MRRSIIVLAMVTAACTEPTVTGSSRDFIIIKADPGQHLIAGSEQETADRECAQYGRKARFVSSQQDNPMAFRYDRFACVD